MLFVGCNLFYALCYYILFSFIFFLLHSPACEPMIAMYVERVQSGFAFIFMFDINLILNILYVGLFYFVIYFLMCLFAGWAAALC
jgi:hypothetical protein